MDPMTLLIGVGVIFCVGYDMSSYNIMKKIDPLYKKKNMFFVGYNTFNVWRSYRKAMENEND